MDGKRIMVCNRWYTVHVVERNYIASENWPAMRVGFTVNDGSIVVEEDDALQHLAAAIEDICMADKPLIPVVA